VCRAVPGIVPWELECEGVCANEEIVVFLVLCPIVGSPKPLIGVVVELCNQIVDSGTWARGSNECPLLWTRVDVAAARRLQVGFSVLVFVG
jgi:hypothetical protein